MNERLSNNRPLIGDQRPSATGLGTRDHVNPATGKVQADPDIILSMLPVAVTFNDKGDAVLEQRPSLSFGFNVARPQSRGEIRLRSADPMPQTDEEWEAYVRQWGGIGYHSIGTCRMGPDGDALAVLDPELRVRSVAGLPVIDASVMPEPVSANTNAPTIAIAERGAALIRGIA